MPGESGNSEPAAAVPTSAKPLSGLRIAVTRPRHQADALARALEARGAEAVVRPLIRIAESADPEALSGAADRIESYDWIVFTSVNGVARFVDVLRARGRGPDALGRPRRLACIGPATAAAVERQGIAVDLIPEEYVAEAVLEALATEVGDLAGTRVLLPRAAGARSVLRDGLEERGAVVDEVEAYRAVRDEAGAAALREGLASGEIDVVTFTASSTVDQFMAAVGGGLGRAHAAAIGPITAATARGHGLAVDVEATEYTIGGLVDALCDFFRARSRASGRAR